MRGCILDSSFAGVRADIPQSHCNPCSTSSPCCVGIRCTPCSRACACCADTSGVTSSCNLCTLGAACREGTSRTRGIATGACCACSALRSPTPAYSVSEALEVGELCGRSIQCSQFAWGLSGPAGAQATARKLCVSEPASTIERQSSATWSDQARSSPPAP